MSQDSSGPGPEGKVERLLEDYGIEEYGDRLVSKWTAEDPDERLSLRALARELNVRLVEEMLDEAGADTINAEAEIYYRQLAGENVSSGVRTQARRSLEKVGIDVDDLQDDFVSRQAIHTYLTKIRGVSSVEGQSSPSVEAVKSTIERLRQRTKQVTASKVERLRDAEVVSIGSFRVIVDVQVYCTDCGQQTSVTDLLTAGHCNCAD